MELYFFDDKKNYFLQCNNFYAYSTLNTNFLNRLANISERGNIFEELTQRYLSVKKDSRLEKLRDDNHKIYNNLDVDFLKKVDKRYLSKAEEIIKSYTSLDSYTLLKENLQSALKSQILINKISNKITELKKEINKDLISVIDYVDKKEEQLNISKVLKDSPLGILIVNKYHSLKLFSSNIDLEDTNFEMQHQAKRLIYIKELESLIKSYQSSKTIYNSENTLILINNLYRIISEYIFLLTDSEFCFTKEAIKKILSYEYDFIDQYLPTYKIILNKIWNYEMENNNQEKYFYVICDINLSDNKLYILNNYNKNLYPDKGYICELPKKIFIESKISRQDILKIPMPFEIKDKYEFDLNCSLDDLNIKNIYTKSENLQSETLPTIYLGGD